eukprot:7341775-Prorocentrum_lima.AAC.1
MTAEATPRQYRCTQCPRLFVNKAALRGHERLSHQTHLLIGDLDADRQCPYCDGVFWDRSHLKRHLLHSG